MKEKSLNPDPGAILRGGAVVKSDIEIVFWWRRFLRYGGFLNFCANFVQIFRYRCTFWRSISSVTFLGVVVTFWLSLRRFLEILINFLRWGCFLDTSDAFYDHGAFYDRDGSFVSITWYFSKLILFIFKVKELFMISGALFLDRSALFQKIKWFFW